MIKHSSRKNEVLTELENVLFSHVTIFVKDTEGALAVGFSLSKQLKLLFFCYKNHYIFHCIILYHGITKNYTFNSIYKVWECFHNEKQFIERQNNEAFWINKALTYKHLTGIIFKH